MNTTVIPSGSDGIWDAVTIPVESARIRLNECTWQSAVGHESTAAIMSKLLDKEIPVNRIQVTPRIGDWLLCFKLKKRAPEGVILTEAQIEELGYEWVLLMYHGTVPLAIEYHNQR